MPHISYNSINFPNHLGPSLRGQNICNFSWAEIIWAAITVGKAKRSHLLSFRQFSIFEIIYRASIIYSNLMENNAGFLCKSPVYQHLDPSEKGAISYFLGTTTAKLFSEKFLNASWLMHLDVYKGSLNPRFGPFKKTKPDLVGLNYRRDWVVMEAKGRSGNLENDLLDKAKSQTRNLRNINGSLPSIRVALVAYFIRDILNVFWKDPEDFNTEAKNIKINEGEFLKIYYKPFIEIFKVKKNDFKEREILNNVFLETKIKPADLIIGISKKIWEKIEKESMLTKTIFEFAQKNFSKIDKEKNLIVGSDGLFVQLGESWSKDKMTKQPHERGN